MALPNYILSPSRPGVTSPGTVPDSSTHTVHDFDVDVYTGFMPPDPPIPSLPQPWDAWELALSDALAQQLQIGDKKNLEEKDKLQSEEWRKRTRKMPILCIEGLTTSEVLLRRAHHVLTFIMHIYIHTLPPGPDSSPIHIPESISIPILRVSSILALPPIITYSDTVLYNWKLGKPQCSETRSLDPSDLHIQTTFTGSLSEEHFYLTSARIELAGVGALTILRSVLAEDFFRDNLALQRISQYLRELAGIIDDMTAILDKVRDACDPREFYEEIRPWFCGQGSRRWIFDGAEAAGLPQPTELSGASAGQSSMIHLLDIFLGVDDFSHSHIPKSDTTPTSFAPHDTSENSVEPFLRRMQRYMPRHHRAFLNQVKKAPRLVRAIVLDEDFFASSEELQLREHLKEAYNASVSALRRFRDAHIRIAALYIVSQARGTGKSSPTAYDQEKGTGGTRLMPFLKGARDRTATARLK